MDKATFDEKVMKPLQRWAALGVKTDDYQTKFIGHRPKDAPQAYMHTIYAPISMDAICAVEVSLKRILPAQFKAFLLHANGIELFGPSGFGVSGMILPHYLPEYKTHPWRFPTDLLDVNKRGWLSEFPESAVIIGHNDGASSPIISMGGDGPIVEFDIIDTQEYTFEWQDFDSWLISEIAEYSLEHDDNGDLIDISLAGSLH